MRIKFWGVRGSIPTPITPQQVQAKITAAVQRITQKDIVNPDARERFIANLPEWIFGTVGGNSSCVEIESSNGDEILLDAGSGIREYGKHGRKPENNHYNLCFSHFHWDHIQGLPFLDSIYNPNAIFNIYSGVNNAKEILSGQQINPYFPPSASFDSLASKMNFYQAKPGETFKIGTLDVNICKMNHPGDSYSFSFEENGKKIVYATDAEITQNDFVVTDERSKVFKNADMIILDSQYTVEESYRKINWGHSAFCDAVDFAVKWGIKSLYLFHHEPTYDDKKLDSILTAARWYTQYIAHSDLKVYLATEGLELYF